jgi:hypothetical protein
MFETGKAVQISARRKISPGAVDALFDAFSDPSAKLLAFSATESEGEISASLVAERLGETVSILETAGFECHAKLAGQ